MRTSSSSLLSVLLGLFLLQCHSEPSITSILTVKEQARVVGSSNTGAFSSPWQASFIGPWQVGRTGENHEAEMLVPDPSTPYQDVKMMDVDNQLGSYAAIIPVKRTPNGMLSLRVELNPRKHSIEKLTLLHARQNQLHTVKQIGNGIGHYDATNQRYYVNVAYQEILEFSDRLNYNSDLQEINCWVSTESNTAAIQYVKFVEL
jgi:hypothetical protein